jgi:signal transduction histidine kinase
MRVKTKILLSILCTIFAVVVVLSLLSIGQLLRQRIELSYANNSVIAHEILYNVRHSLETGLRGKQFDPNNPGQLRDMVADTLRNDEDLQSVLMSVIGYSPAVYDISVVDTNNTVLIGTDSSTLDQPIPARKDFAALAHSSFLHQVQTVFGRPQVFDVSVPLERNHQPFATVRVGIRTTFLEAEIEPSLHRAIILVILLALASLLVSALLANLALRPLSVISARLDELSQSHTETLTDGRPDQADEVAVVSTKIERLGQRMRNVQEVFSAMKENLDQILGNLQDGLVLFTNDGRAVLVSAAAARFLGLDRDRILNSSVHDILDRTTPLGRAICDAFDAKIVLMQEEVITEIGARVQVSLDFIHDDHNTTGSALGALLTLHDAESIQQLEDDLEISRRLAAIGRLTAGVGHEVKNPINAIVVHVELLRNKLADGSSESQKHIEVIHGEVQRLNRVVQTLVDFSRPVELRLAEHDLRDIVSSVIELEGVALRSKGVTLEANLSARPLPVNVDADLIKQAILNLVQNAAQAMPAGGTISLLAERSGRDAALTVRDDGIGIAASQLDKIFNLYFTTKPTGSGIGLAMTYRILQLHNGRIDVESTEGVGTAFTLTLPLSATDLRARPALAAGHVSQTQEL